MRVGGTLSRFPTQTMSFFWNRCQCFSLTWQESAVGSDCQCDLAGEFCESVSASAEGARYSDINSSTLPQVKLPGNFPLGTGSSTSSRNHASHHYGSHHHGSHHLHDYLEDGER